MLFRKCFEHLPQIERKRIITPLGVLMRLNRGERPMSLPGGLQVEIVKRLTAFTPLWQQYPDYGPFYTKLREYLKLKPNQQMVVGAGIEEFLRTLMFLCCDPGQKVVYPSPTCAMYDIYAKGFGLKSICYAPEPGEDYDINDLMLFLEAITSCKLVFLVNPSQPVETCFSIRAMWKMAEWCQERGVLLAIDEAHYGFGAPTALGLVEDFDNVVVLRTFSKFFGAASIRVGYAVGQDKVIKTLDAVRPSGEISGPSLEIASVLLDHADVLERSALETAAARDWLRSQINSKMVGVTAYGEYGFSLLLKFDSREIAIGVAAVMAGRGVFVKCDFPPPVEDCILLACGDVHLMKLFYTVLVWAYDVYTTQRDSAANENKGG